MSAMVVGRRYYFGLKPLPDNLKAPEGWAIAKVRYRQGNHVRVTIRHLETKAVAMGFVGENDGVLYITAANATSRVRKDVGK